MITWGIASTLTMLATGPMSLYLLRLIVDIAEAGFLPGVMLYMTYWFPARRRGRVTALFMVAQPLAIGCGSLVSALIMHSLDTSLGVAGWQWLFILTGLRAVIMGAAVLFYLPDTPAAAPWLTQAEREAIGSALAFEAPSTEVRHGGGASRALLARPFLQLCLAYFCLVTSLNALGTWSPLIVRSVFGNGASIFEIGCLAAIPGLVAAVVMPFWAHLSDRRQERFFHYTIPVAVAALGWLAVILFSIPALRLAGLVLCTAGGFTGMVILWTFPPSLWPIAARPLGIAVLSCAGIAASITSPAIIGFLHDATRGFSAGILYSVVLLVASIGLILGLRSRAPAPAAWVGQATPCLVPRFSAPVPPGARCWRRPWPRRWAARARSSPMRACWRPPARIGAAGSPARPWRWCAPARCRRCSTPSTSAPLPGSRSCRRPATRAWWVAACHRRTGATASWCSPWRGSTASGPSSRNPGP